MHIHCKTSDTVTMAAKMRSRTLEFSRCNLFLFCVVVLVSLASAAEISGRVYHRNLSNASTPHHFTSNQKMALQQVVRTMMGFSRDVSVRGFRSTDTISNSEGIRSESHHAHRVAPRYMHRLYEKYLSGEPVGTHPWVADTVRNINADLAIVNNGSLFVFNLTSLTETETVLRAEIHIYKRRLKNLPADNQSSDNDFIVVKAYELGPAVLRQRASFRIPDARHSGWHSFDVTSPVQACFSSQRNSATPRMLAVSFADGDQRNDTDGRSGAKLRLSNFMRKLSKPVLIVFSQESRNTSLEVQLDSLFSQSEDRQGDGKAGEKDSWRWDYDNPLLFHNRPFPKRRNRPPVRTYFPSNSQEFRGTRRLNLSDEVFEMETFSGTAWNTNASTIPRYGIGDEIGGQMRSRFYHAEFAPSRREGSLNEAHGHRERRFVIGNEIPHEDSSSQPEPIPPVHYNLPKTNPMMLRGRTRSGRRSMATTSPPIREFGADVKEEAAKANAKGTHNQRRGEDQSLRTIFPHPGRRHKQIERGERRQATGRKEIQGFCAKKKLVVDFAEIGWKDWIISPKSFEAHYCDGLCAYPMAPRLHPTNHATIQSIVKVIGLQTEVPSPCCIPASLSSVTLLYFDQNQNVVLKNFPDMTVRSCACR